jgi:hypothetical protein
MVLRALIRQDAFVPQLPRQSREGVLADKVDVSRVMFDVVDGVLKVGRHGGFGHVDYCRVDAEVLCGSTGDVLHGVSKGKGATAEQGAESPQTVRSCPPLKYSPLPSKPHRSTGRAHFAAGTDDDGGMPQDRGLGQVVVCVCTDCGRAWLDG